MTNSISVSSLLKKKVLVLCGTGGVGKTSVSASLGILAANRGRHVLVLTIDPSKRLAQTLGIDTARETVREIPRSLWQIPGAGKTGSLCGMVLNPKQTFDEVVRRFSKSKEAAETILANPIYEHLSSILAGSQEYMAMEKLLSVVEQGSGYDLVILDTPPSQHALDFLNAPQKMVRAIGDSVLKYFLKPGLLLGRSGFKLLRRGPKAFVSLLDKVAGINFLEEISELLILAQGLLSGFAERAQAVEALLRSPETGFYMVSTLSAWSAHEARAFYKSLQEKGISPCGLFLNRTIPAFEWNLSKDEEKAFVKDVIDVGKAAYESYRALYLRECREEDSIQAAIGNTLPMWKLSLLSQEVHDLETLKTMALAFGDA